MICTTPGIRSWTGDWNGRWSTDARIARTILRAGRSRLWRGFVAEPERDDGDVDAGVEQVHRRRVRGVTCLTCSDGQVLAAVAVCLATRTATASWDSRVPRRVANRGPVSAGRDAVPAGQDPDGAGGQRGAAVLGRPLRPPVCSAWASTSDYGASPAPRSTTTAPSPRTPKSKIATFHTSE